MTCHVRLRVLVDGINDNAELRGPDRYILSLLAELADLAPASEFLLCHAPWQEAVRAASLADNVRRIELDSPRGRLKRAVWHATAFKGWADRQGFDMVFLPNIVLMPTLRTPCVMTVHDVAHFSRPEKFGYIKGRVQRVQVYWATRHPARLIAVSHSTRADMIGRLGTAPSRISVIEEGSPKPVERTGVAVDPPLLLYVGRVEKSKGVEGLVESFNASEVLARARARLVIAGSTGNAEQQLRRVLAASPPGRVERLGFVSEERLKELYTTCTAFVFPSRAEGFGLVLLEAMAHGAPVIAMRATAVPEVVGDAGILVDPADPDGLRLAMERIVTDPTLRATLAKRGYRRLEQFSWRRAAEQTLLLFQEALR
jgi:glycosyltransferase involved in cell wall biosynthesis